MQQAIVRRHLRPVSSAFVLEYRKAQCARCRSHLWYIVSRSYGQTPMHKRVSCALSRLSSSESATILRVSGCLSGLHPIHLYWPRTGMTDPGFCSPSVVTPAPDLSIPPRFAERSPRKRFASISRGKTGAHRQLREAWAHSKRASEIAVRIAI